MRNRGFTMLEILVATALTALVLIGLNTLIFSMAELWGNNNPRRTFDLHARAVTAYLGEELRSAAFAVPVATTTTAATGGTGQQGGQQPAARGGAAAGGQAGSSGAFAWQNPTNTGFGASGAPILTFTLPGGSRLLNWGAGRPLPDVVCALQVRAGEGLLLLWHSQYETNFLTDPPRETLISPLVTALQYEFYDANLRQWTALDQPETDNTGQAALPGRLRLVFGFENLSEEMSVILPMPGQGLPPY
jgi:prepilin-type N-terminal cleavage/methylation domain-containing protein